MSEKKSHNDNLKFELYKINKIPNNINKNFVIKYNKFDDTKNKNTKLFIKIFERKNHFEREKEILIMLNKKSSKYIIKYIDINLNIIHKYISIEYIKYCLFDSIVNTHKNINDIIDTHENVEMPEYIIKKLAFQIISGIDFLHDNNIIHNDLKPENILINRLNLIKNDNFTIKIIDFNLSLFITNNINHIDKNKECEYGGSIEYCSPEKLRKKKIDKSTDIFSYGVCLYVIKYGHYLFLDVYNNIIDYNYNYRIEILKKSDMLLSYNCENNIINKILYNSLKINPKERLNSKQLKYILKETNNNNNSNNDDYYNCNNYNNYKKNKKKEKKKKKKKKKKKIFFFL